MDLKTINILMQLSNFIRSDPVKVLVIKGVYRVCVWNRCEWMVEPQERQKKKELRLFKKYQKAKALKQCVMEYFQYGFDPDYDCGCPDCELYSKAMDIVEDKNVNLPAMDALLNNGFTKDEAQNQIDIFIDVGVFTDLELAGENLTKPNL